MGINSTLRNAFREFWTNTKIYVNEEKSVPLRNYFNDWSLGEKIWFAVSTVMVIIASILIWDYQNSARSIILLMGCITGLWSLILIAKAKISNFILGLTSIILYTISAYMWGVQSVAIIYTLFFIPMEFYSWYIWTKIKNKAASDKVKVQTFQSIEAKGNYCIVLCAVIVCMYVTTGLFACVLYGIGVDRPYFIAAVSLLLGVSAVLKAHRFVEHWIITIPLCINLIATILLSKIDHLDMGVIILLSLLVINYSWGLVNWMKLNDDTVEFTIKKSTKGGGER